MSKWTLKKVHKELNWTQQQLSNAKKIRRNAMNELRALKYKRHKNGR